MIEHGFRDGYKTNAIINRDDIASINIEMETPGYTIDQFKKIYEGLQSFHAMQNILGMVFYVRVTLKQGKFAQINNDPHSVYYGSPMWLFMDKKQLMNHRNDKPLRFEYKEASVFIFKIKLSLEDGYKTKFFIEKQLQNIKSLFSQMGK